MNPNYSRSACRSNLLRLATPRLAFACLAASTGYFANSAYAVDGTYTSDTGAWNLPGSWLDGIVADGADSTAFFTNDVTAARTTSLGGNRTIGNITYTDGDIATPFDRTLANNILTLDVTTGSPTINVTQTGRTFRLNLPVAGNDGLTKTGPGNLVLSGANTFSGPVLVTQGALQYGFNTAGGESSGTHEVIVGSGAELRFRHNTQVVVYNAPISGAGRVQFNYANTSTGGSLTLGGNNTFSGGLTVNPTGSTTNILPLKAGGTTAFGTGNVTITTAGKLDLNGFSNTVGLLVSTGTNGIVSNDGNAPATLTLSSDSATPQTFGGIIADGLAAISIAKSGTATQTFTGLNTYSGSTTVTGGTLSITNDDRLSDTKAVNLATGAVLNLAFTGTDTVGALSIDGIFQPAGVYGRVGAIVDLGAQFESALITGDGLLNNVNTGEALPYIWDATGTSWSSAASWTTSAANSAANPAASPGPDSVPIFGADGISADTIELAGNQTAAGLSFISPVIFTLTGGGVSSDLTLGASGIILDADAGGVVIGSAAGGQDVDVILSAGQTWNNINPAADVSTLNALDLGANAFTLAGAGTFTLAGPVTGTGALTLSGAGNVTFGDSISGVSSLEITGAGNALFNGPVSGTGALTLGGAGTATFSGAVGGFGSFVAGGAGNVLFNGSFTNSGTTSKRGGGNVAFAGGTTASGDLAVDNGSLTFSGSSPIVLGGITLRGYGDSGTTYGTVATLITFDAGTTASSASDRTIQLGNTTFSGGFATQTLNANGAFTYDGNLFVGRAGRLNVGGTWTQNGPATVAAQGGGTPILTVSSGGQFTYGSFTNFQLNTSTSLNSVTRFIVDGGVATTGIHFNNSQATAAEGTSSDLVLTNNGTLRLSANIPDFFTTAGATRRLQLGVGGGTFDTNGFSTTLNAPVFGEGGLTKSGAGTLTLTDINTYGGDTTITGGTLVLAQDNTANDLSTVSIASGAFLSIGTGVTDTVGNLILDGVAQAAGDYTSANSGGRIIGDGTLRVVTPPVTDPYVAWIGGFDLTLADVDTTADPDKDGLNNLLEFVLNGNPTVSDTSILPQLVVTPTAFEFTYQRRKDSIAATTQTFQWGTTLATWPGNAVVPAESASLPPATVTVSAGTPSDTITDTVKVGIPLTENGGLGRLFGRLQITETP